MKFDVRFPLSQLTAELRQAQGKLASDKQRLLQQCGVQLLSFAQQAYRQKARGGQGSDGISWAKLKRSTLKARVMRRAAGKRIVAQRKALAAQIRALLGKGRPKGLRKAQRPKRGRFLSRIRKGFKTTRKDRSPTKRLQRRLKKMRVVKGKGKTIADQVAKLRRKRLELLVKLEQLVDREVARHEIGVDTGLQRASSSPGFQGPDGKGGTTFLLTPQSVTVGYGRKYSGWFDETRKLLPDRLPGPWASKLESLSRKWATDILNQTIGG